MRAYESKALSLFRRHGGEILTAFVPETGPAGAPGPDEIQVLRIPDRRRFEAFLSDPERAALAEMRDASVGKTEVFLSAELIPY